MATDLHRGIRFPFHSPATCSHCNAGKHADCDGRARSSQIRATTHCECQRVGHAPLLSADT